MKNAIKITASLVEGGRAFRQQARKDRANRIHAMKAMAKALPETDVFLLPAGYLNADKSEFKNIENEVFEQLRDVSHGKLWIFGLDTFKHGSKRKAERGSTGYPFHIFAKENQNKHLFQQIATRAEENKDVATLDKLWSDRSIQFGEHTISVLICGELFCEHLWKKTISVSPNIILVPAHQGVNLGENRKRSWKIRMKKLRKQFSGTVVMAEHTRSGLRAGHIQPDRQNIEVDVHNFSGMKIWTKTVRITNNR